MRFWLLFFPPARLYADAADVVTEPERFRKELQLFIATDVVEVFSSFLDGSGGASGETGAARAAVPGGRGMDLKGKVGEDGQQADPCPELFGYKEIVPADPPDSRGLRRVLVGEMASLTLPVDKLGGGDGNRLKSEVLNGVVENEADRVEEDIDPLVMVKIERRGLIFNPFQNNIGKMIPN